MRGGAPEGDEQWALDRFSSGTPEERARAAAVLSRGSGREVDEALLALVADADRDVAELAGRVLAERDPDRDPAYTERFVGDRAAAAARSPRTAAVVDWMNGELPLGVEEWGFPRLRRLEPVRRYAAQLRGGSALARSAAALGLGDTADPAAFDALLTALADPNRTVRATAVQAVRRLARGVAGEAFRDHPVRERLAGLLADRSRAVRLEAARALCVLGDGAVVAEARGRVPWWRAGLRRDLDDCLAGRVPPLPRTWPGGPEA